MPNPVDASPTRSDSTNAAATILAGRYRIARRLGRGGMASIYLATDLQRAQPVAVKLLHAARLTQQGQKERFLDEARIASRLKHPNIVELLDWGEADGGRLFIVMEFIEGEELKRLLRRRHMLRWQDAAPILLQICGAMEAAHRAQVVHRDLKPENVLLQPRDGFAHFVKVLDFGTAKALDDPAERKRLTRTGMVVGTPSVLAPEQIEGKVVDARTDIYALGAIMYRMLCGAMPFSHPNVIKLMFMQLNDPVRPPTEVSPSAPIPPAAEAIALRALAKAPQDRFASMHEMAQAIAQVAPI